MAQQDTRSYDLSQVIRVLVRRHNDGHCLVHISILNDAGDLEVIDWGEDSPGYVLNSTLHVPCIGGVVALMTLISVFSGNKFVLEHRQRHNASYEIAWYREDQVHAHRVGAA